MKAGQVNVLMKELEEKIPPMGKLQGLQNFSCGICGPIFGCNGPPSSF